MKKRLKTNGIIMFFAFIAVVIFPDIFLRRARSTGISYSVEILGIACIFLGQLFRVSARGFKADNSGEGKSLIKSGPYSLVRNPMYLGILLIGIGVVFMLSNWWTAGIFLAIFIARYIILTFQEEKKLYKLFPGVYRTYCLAVPRLMPSVEDLFRADIKKFLPLKPRWIKREFGSMLVLLLIVLSCWSWNTITSSGVRIYLIKIIPVLLVATLFILSLIHI